MYILNWNQKSVSVVNIFSYIHMYNLVVVSIMICFWIELRYKVRCIEHWNVFDIMHLLAFIQFEEFTRRWFLVVMRSYFAILISFNLCYL